MRMQILAVPLVPAAFVAALIGAGAAGTAAGGDPPLRFDEAEIFVELNDTDGDLGLHASIDGGPWTSLEIEGPRDLMVLDILSRGPLRRQGLTQLFFESAEPTFDELPPARFFERFPEGRYEIEGRSQDGREITSMAVLSHVLAAPPAPVLLSGMLAAENCEVDPLPKLHPPVFIDWDPVTESHPEIGRPGPVKIERYQLFVEGPGITFSVDLPPSVTEFEVPIGITALGSEFKFEIIARTTTGNNTAVESCFELH